MEALGGNWSWGLVTYWTEKKSGSFGVTRVGHPKIEWLGSGVVIGVKAFRVKLLAWSLEHWSEFPNQVFLFQQESTETEVEFLWLTIALAASWLLFLQSALRLQLRASFALYLPCKSISSWKRDALRVYPNQKRDCSGFRVENQKIRTDKNRQKDFEVLELNWMKETFMEHRFLFVLTTQWAESLFCPVSIQMVSVVEQPTFVCPIWLCVCVCVCVCVSVCPRCFVLFFFCLCLYFCISANQTPQDLFSLFTNRLVLDHAQVSFW